MADPAVDPTPDSLEAALQLLAAQQAELARLRGYLGEMDKVLAHDLRAPLRHVISFAPLLRETIDDIVQAGHCDATLADDAREFAQTMEQSARKMAEMLAALLQRHADVR
jgi:signal transduction histidine kinase